jgi:hypothetical protein
MTHDQAPADTQWSEEGILDLIRKLRNDLIKDFLDEGNLHTYFREQYKRELTAVKVEFIKKDLKELLITPVDVPHYATLITQIQDTGTASLEAGNDRLFYHEVEQIFRKYNY